MDIYNYLNKKKLKIDLFDPVANSKEFFQSIKRLSKKLNQTNMMIL